MSPREHPGAAEKCVGILGGMGPEATVDLMQRIIRATPAQGDADHLRMLVDNNPKVPSRIAALIEGHGASPLPVLLEMSRGLVRHGADFLVMPCNTAHHYYAELAASVDVPFLNMMELVARHLRSQPGLLRKQPGALHEQPELSHAQPELLYAQREAPVRVGLLASTALRHIKLYEPWLAAIGAEVVYPEDECQAALMALIGAVKSGSVSPSARAAFSAAAAGLQEAQVDCLLIACTELSVISESLQAGLPVYDAADILAAAVVSHARTGSSVPARPSIKGE